MRLTHLEYLACPTCSTSLAIKEVTQGTSDSVETGQLECPDCGSSYPILRHIPRFTAPHNYAASFGLEWNKHPRTQYDSHTGLSLSEARFFEETRWPRSLPGQTILEVGSGSGRFTEWAASTGAMVVSTDYSSAVEANYRSNGQKENVLIVQADIYSMPFHTESFDKVFCLGVLQHTPDVEKSFNALLNYLKPGGSLVIDVYRRTWWRYLSAAFWLRPLTSRLPPDLLYTYCRYYVEILWPAIRLINKLPKGQYISRALSIADYTRTYPLPQEILKEWAILDTFDGFSPAYNAPQSLTTVCEWFRRAGMQDVEVRYGYNGIEGRGTKPAK